MKLVQMPRDLLTVELDDLPALGVHPALIEAVAARCAGDPLAVPSLALLGPRAAGTTAALMVLARRIGVALRDANIRLRDTGSDLRRGRRKLCYLPGSALPAALDAADTRRALQWEAAVFLQDLDGAWKDTHHAEEVELAVAALVADRRRHGSRTFVSADPTALPAAVYETLDAELEIVAVNGGR